MAESQFGGLEVGNQITKFPGISKDRWVMVGEVIRIVKKWQLLVLQEGSAAFQTKKWLGYLLEPHMAKHH